MPDISLRALTRADFPLLREWLNEPHVRAWWRGPAPELADVEREYGPSVDGAEPTLCRVILAGGEPAGLIQGYRHDDYPDWDLAVGVPDALGVDYLIGPPDRRGRSVAPAAIAAFARELLALHPDLAVVVAVPQLANRASCRALEKAGFAFSRVTGLDTDDPSDIGPAAVYVYARPPADPSTPADASARADPTAPVGPTAPVDPTPPAGPGAPTP